MRQTSLKKNIIRFSPLILGTMRLGKWGSQLSAAQWEAFIERCLALGLKDFDHADIYGDYTTEAEFGAVIKAKSSLRSQMQITTKCGIKKPDASRPQNRIKSYDSSGAHIRWSVEQSLKNFHTDYLDVLLLHRPDFLMDVYEVAETFDRLRAEGKVRHFGVSNFSSSQFELLHAQVPLVTHQLQFSLNRPEALSDGTLDQLQKFKLAPSAWSPLGGGELMQQIDRKEPLKRVVETLTKKYELSTAQLLLAWIKRHPAGIIPVLGTSKIERIEEAMAVHGLEISQEDWYDLYVAAQGEKLP